MLAALSPIDYGVLAVYLLLVAAIGIAASFGQKSTKDYFLGGKSVPWVLAGLSIIATETSALTFIGAPVQSLRGDWTYIQLALGSILARFVVAGLLIGAYYKAEVFTVYGYLGQRFGPWTKNCACLLFFIGRSLGSGVRLFGAAMALAVVTDLDFLTALTMITVVALLYTISGGIRSVIWTDSLQGLLLFVGGIVTIVYLASSMDGGLSAAFAKLSEATTADGHSKLRVFDFDFRFDKAYTLVGGILGVAFLTMSTHGTDQDMVQRALTCRDSRAGKRSLFLSAFLTIPVVVIFLTVGSLLWLHYGGDEKTAELALQLGQKHGSTKADWQMLFPFYVVSELPNGIKGLILCGLFAASMSSLDSAMAALSSTAVKNIWQPYVKPGRSEAYYLRVSRLMTVFFGLVLISLAILVWRLEVQGSAKEGFGILMLGLKVLTWIFPPLLGVFMLGVLTRRGRDLGNIVAIAVGVGTLLFVEFWGSIMPEVKDPVTGVLADATPPWAWVWNSLIGCVLSFSVAALFSAESTGKQAAATTSPEA